jgi:hypothetical protein
MDGCRRYQFQMQTGDLNNAFGGFGIILRIIASIILRCRLLRLRWWKFQSWRFRVYRAIS